MTAEEYVNNAITKNKNFYKKSDKMIDEMITLLGRIKENETEDRKWRLITAVSEAYHVVLWDYEDKNQQRLLNTIRAFFQQAGYPF